MARTEGHPQLLPDVSSSNVYSITFPPLEEKKRHDDEEKFGLSVHGEGVLATHLLNTSEPKSISFSIPVSENTFYTQIVYIKNDFDFKLHSLKLSF